MSTSGQLSVNDLAALLGRKRFQFSNEKELQEGLALVLTQAGIPFQREVPLTPLDRIDFLVDGIGIELKVDGSTAAVTRQLWRYASHSKVHSLILVTSRRKHVLVPSEVKGKPVFVFHLINSCF